MTKVDVIRIELELADGSLERATGPDATAIWDHILGLFVLDHVHGGRYNGPKMKPVEREERKEADVARLVADRAALLDTWIMRNGPGWQIRREVIPSVIYLTRQKAEEAVLAWAHSRPR